MKRIISVFKHIYDLRINPDTHEEISERLWEDNRKTLMFFSGVAGACMIIMIIMSFVNVVAYSHQMLYFAALVLMIIVFVLAKVSTITRTRNLTMIGMYAFMGLLQTFGIVLGTVESPDKNAVTFIAMMIILPVIFTDRPIRMIPFILISGTVFIIASHHYKVFIMYQTDLVDVIIFSIVSIIMSLFMTKMKYERYEYEVQVALMSETDMLTGVRNRNSYEQNLKKYPKRCLERIHCVFVDVNGMHETNNAKGHMAGDHLLKVVSAALREEFGKENTYRIGGDEFVAFAVDESDELVQEKLARIRHAVRKGACDVSMGCCEDRAPRIDMKDLIQRAEKLMYADKAQYYRVEGNDRRTRK